MTEKKGLHIKIDDIEKIKSKLKRVHGSYFEDKTLVWNLLNFIACSQWNHRWGRKYAHDDTIEKLQQKQLNEVWGRNKNLLSWNRKLKDDLSEAKQEINKLKQLLVKNCTTTKLCNTQP